MENNMKNKIITLKQQYTSLKEKLVTIEQQMKTIKAVSDVIEGILKTQEQQQDKNYDPGKYGAAYYYVKEIDEEDCTAARDFKPHQYDVCERCKQKAPLLMSYEQTYDSPEGDTWEKDVFLICCDKYQKKRHFASSDRFFAIE